MAAQPSDDWVDALPLVQSALADLETGQLIREERYSMMDLMAAIEINDARTDSYLSARNALEKAQELPRFDPQAKLSVQEMLWVLDEIMRLEATFQDGHPLVSTLWTCNYFRPAALSAVSGLSSTSPCQPPVSQSLQGVFRAMLLGVLKSNEIIWEELCKSQQSPQAPPTERTVSVDDILRALDEALAWLQEKEQVDAMDAVTREELVTRVTLRIDLLYILALLTFPAHTSPTQVSHHLARVTSYLPLLPSLSCSDLPSSFSPSPALLAIFCPSPSVPLLSTSQPPRHIEPFPVGEAYNRSVREVVKELGGLCELWEGWKSRPGQSGGGWKELREYCKQLERRQAAPYSIIASTPSHLFTSIPLLTLSASFLSTLTALPSPILLVHLVALRASEHSYASPAHVAVAWAERLSAELLRTTSSLAGQNRARQHRWVRKSALPAGGWAQLVHEAEAEIVPLLQSLLPAVHRRSVALIPTAMRVHFAELSLEALLSGFEGEMELYGEEERPSVWSVAERISREVERMWEALGAERGEEEGGAWLRARRDELATLFPPPRPTKFATPFLPSLAVDSEKAEEGRFRQRFDWLSSASEGSSGLGLERVVRWQDYKVEVERLRGVERQQLAKDGLAAYTEAIEAFTVVGSIPLAERGSAIRPEFALR
ncbi:SPOSA6832_01365, partial [Sporobolomyces salmonicolor]